MLTDNEVQDGQRYTYKGNTYVVDQCDDIEVKDPNDSNWYPAVIYHATNEDGEHPERRFVRRLDDFQNKFNLVEE